MKRHIESFQKGSKADQYVVHNLTCLGVHLRSTLSNTLLQKVLTLVPPTATRPEVFVACMHKFLSDSYDYLDEALTHITSLKIKFYPGENITDFCTEVLVNAERLESLGTFKLEHLGYIPGIFENNSDSRFHLRGIHKYKEVTEFNKKLHVCDTYVISPEEIITYGSLIQEATHE